MIESSINTFEVQKGKFLNAARKTLFDIQKNGMRLDNDGIVALLESAFSSGWTSAKQDTQNAVIGALSGQIRVDFAKDIAIPGENTPKVDIPDVPRERKNIDFEKRVMLAKKFRNKYVEEYGCATERSVDVIWNLISM